MTDDGRRLAAETAPLVIRCRSSGVCLPLSRTGV
jgi:hypothetical protein